jgi:hypothetical protein
MFCYFDAKTLLSTGRNPFALTMDASGMFENPAWINTKDSQFNKYWVTDLRGIDVGQCFVSSKINGRMNKQFLRDYRTNDAALSPFNAYTRQQGPLTCADNVVVSEELFPFVVNGGSYILTRGATTSFKDTSDLSEPAPLVLVDVKYTNPSKVFEPAYDGVFSMPSSTTVGTYTFLGDSNLVAVGAADTSAGGNDLYVLNLNNPTDSQTLTNFGGDLFYTYDVLYVDSRKLLFAINYSTEQVDVYNMQTPGAPVLVTNLAMRVRSLAWSEKRQQLYATGPSNICICSLLANGLFETYKETFNDVGILKKIAYNDSLDMAVASAQPDWNYVGKNELLVLGFQNAGNQTLSSGRVSLIGRWIHPESGYYVSVDDVALSPDGNTGYVVIRNNNRYMDLYRFNLSVRSAPAVMDSVYNTTSISDLIGGIGLSPNGQFLACTRNGLDIFDLQHQTTSYLQATKHLNDPETYWPSYGSVEFSADGNYMLTGRVGHANHVIRIKLFR